VKAYRFTALVVATALALVSAPLWAQQGTSDIRGQVTDQQGAVLPGATVTVRNQETGMFRTTLTTAEGAYFISGIVPGRYEVTAELDGFRKVTTRDILVEIGKTAHLDLRLEVGQLTEAVTVTGASPIVDVTSKEVGGNITSRELTELPSINRNYIGFVGLLPGIIPTISAESFGSDSVTVNGQDARNNNYMLDGANNNDDAIGQRAGTQTRTPLESIQEFQVITNQFDAEFGRTTGAVINAVTKSGTNRLRGSAFTLFQDASLTEKDYFAEKRGLAKPDTKRQEFGGTLGGPIIRDKAHFFGSIERVLIDDARLINIASRPDLNAAPVTETRVWNYMLRFDNQINANHTWGVRWLYESSPQLNQVIPQGNPLLPVSVAARREEDDVDQTVVGTLSSVMGGSRLNTLRLAFTQEDVAFANPCFNGNGRDQLACDPTLQFQTYWDQQSDVAQARINNAYQLEDTFSWFVPGKRGDHDIKLGVQYQYVEVDSEAFDNLNGTFGFGRNDLPFDPGNPRTYPDRLTIRVPGSSSSLVKANYYSAFAQDKWRMTDRLTASIGLRYDLEVIPTPGADQPELGVVGSYPVDKNNFSPRIGFSYDLHGTGRTVVRGGYGIFYDKTHFDLGITGLYTAGVFSNSFTVNFPTNNADPGPREGRLPTDPMLVNGPVVNRDLLNQRYPPGASVKNTGNVSLDNPDRVVPMNHQATIGFEKQLASDLAFNVDYVHVWGRDFFMTKDLNAGLRAQPVPTSPIIRAHRDLFTAAVNQLVNVGVTDYDALQMQFEKRFSRNYSARVSYTLAYARGNTPNTGSPTSGFQVLDDMNLDLNEGPTNLDRRHNLAISGTAQVPRTGGLTVSWIARALSGSPFTLTNGNVDPDRNGSQTEPLPGGPYRGVAPTPADEPDVYEVDFESKRNGAYGPGFFQLDMRVGYRIRPRSDMTVDLYGEVYNLTNRVNFGNPGGNQAAPTTFLMLNNYRDGAVPRTGQFGIRFAF
jgi:hypothetical protein